MTIHEIRTHHSPAEVLDLAEAFLTHFGSGRGASVEWRGTASMKLHMEVGEIVIGVQAADEATIVRGSASRGADLLSRFLITLGRAQDARQTVHRSGLHRTMAAQVETFSATAGIAAANAVPQAA